MDYVIAIPSHRRPELIWERTLNYLSETNVDASRVHLFLSDAVDLRTYDVQSEIKKVLCNGAKNATDKFNSIHNYFNTGVPVFVMEDDITCLCYRDENAKPQRQWVRDLDGLIRDSFDLCDGWGIWGVNPHDSTHYTMMYTPEGAKKENGRQYRYSNKMNLIVAHAFGFISTRDPALAVSEPSKTDYERSCLYYTKYGRVLRRMDIGVSTKSYINEGGMQSNHTREERYALEEKACDSLVHRFPELVDYNFHKESIYPELRIIYR